MKKKKSRNLVRRYVSANRMLLLILLVVFLVGSILFRFYFLQVREHEKYVALAEAQYKIKRKLVSRRGEIFFQEGTKLVPAAVNKNMPTLYIDPTEIKNKEETVGLLTDILHLDEQFVRQKVNKINDPYEVLKKKLSEEEVKRVKQASLPGVYLQNKEWRYYPGKTLAAQTLGFLGYKGNELVGRYGVEQYFDSLLRGRAGFLEEDKDARGKWMAIGNKIFNPSYDGADLILTINPTIQFKVEKVLEAAVKKHKADGAKAIVVDPRTGRIMAMAAWPTFDPNEYYRAETKLFKNPNVSDAYEPGSVFKILTMAAGLDAGRVTPETVYTDTGVVEVGGFTIKNSDGKAHGQQTMTQVIEKSLNTGAIFVEKRLGNKLFADYIKAFGFGKKTGIELPAEVSGNITHLHSKGDTEYYTASYGQGVTVTPLQLVMAYSALANGGVLMKPIIVDRIEKNGQLLKERKPQLVRQVVSAESAKQAALMLEANVKKGHGKLAGVPGYRIAGKTGTAQIPDLQNGGYLEGVTEATFAGFAPVENPVFAMVVIIDHPRDVEWAAATAAPAFGEISRFLLSYFSQKPTEAYTEKDWEIFHKKHDYLLDIKNQTKEYKQDDENDTD